MRVCDAHLSSVSSVIRSDRCCLLHCAFMTRQHGAFGARSVGNDVQDPVRSAADGPRAFPARSTLLVDAVALEMIIVGRVETIGDSGTVRASDTGRALGIRSAVRVRGDYRAIHYDRALIRRRRRALPRAISSSSTAPSICIVMACDLIANPRKTTAIRRLVPSTSRNCGAAAPAPAEALLGRGKRGSTDPPFSPALDRTRQCRSSAASTACGVSWRSPSIARPGRCGGRRLSR